MDESSLAWAQGWHEFSVTWKADTVSFAVDDVTFVTNKCACAGSPTGNCGLTQGYFSRNPTSYSPWTACAPFDRKFHLIINMAIGGGWPDNPTKDTLFPQSLLFDWVRVTAL